jgi:hypothetical protein
VIKLLGYLGMDAAAMTINTAQIFFRSGVHWRGLRLCRGVSSGKQVFEYSAAAG